MSVTLDVSCADLGLACSHEMTARDEQELADEVRRHAADHHDVRRLNDTLLDYAISRARRTEES